MLSVWKIVIHLHQMDIEPCLASKNHVSVSDILIYATKWWLSSSVDKLKCAIKGIEKYRLAYVELTQFREDLPGSQSIMERAVQK